MDSNLAHMLNLSYPLFLQFPFPLPTKGAPAGPAFQQCIDLNKPNEKL